MINKYKTTKILGNGSFGKVYEVIDQSKTNQTKLAVKVLNKKDIYSNIYLIKAFSRELEVMKECECNNSVKLIENFNSENSLYIVMELCDEDLEAYVNKHKGYISENHLKEIMIGLNNVFKIMFNKNIVHRDLKLKNIMIKYNKKEELSNNKINFVPKLCDFGFSKVLEDDITKTKLGTPSTMAPEIMMNKTYTNKCDIWSLGVIMYQILFKTIPFKARNEQEILLMILRSNGEFQIPKDYNISNELKDLLKKMLTVDPANRISWEEYFNHPFFKNEAKMININKSNSNEDIIDKMLEYNFNKCEHIINYFSNLYNVKIIEESNKLVIKKKINNGTKSNYDYYSNYKTEICIFNILVLMEISFIKEFINNKIESDSELSLIQINNNNNKLFDYTFINLNKDNFKVNLNIELIDKYSKIINSLDNKIYILIKYLFKEQEICIEEINLFEYLQNNIKDSYLSSYEKYFFAMFDKAREYISDNDYENAYKECLISKYYYEVIIFIRMVSHNKSLSISFNKLFKLFIDINTFSKDNFILINKNNITTNINNDSYLLFSFLSGMFKSFKSKNIIESELTSESTVQFSKNAFESILVFYPLITKTIDQCKQQIMKTIKLNN